MLIFWLLASLALFGTLIYLLQLGSILKYAASPVKTKEDNSGQPPAYPPVSLLKPLKGLDDSLAENLESFCRQDYPDYEIIFCLQDPQDPAAAVVEEIKKKYPQVNITLLAEPCQAALNPKVNNMLPGYAKARHPLVLISDSNVRVCPQYLKSIMASMNDPQVGLVTNLIQGVEARTAGAAMENLHLNSFIMGSICLLELWFNMTLVVGKSMLMRKEALEAVGGLAGVKDFLAEDYIIGKSIKASGRRVVISHYLIENVNQSWDIKRFMSRHARWAKMRWHIAGIKYFPELFTNPVLMSLLLLLAFPALPSLGLALGVSAVKILGDFYLGKRLNSDLKGRYYLLTPVKDLLMALVWFVPFFSSTVSWRGNTYKIGKDSRLERVE